MKDFDILIVGCGLSGSVIARQSAEKGKRVLVLERREHIGGNMRDHINDAGILVHDYGPHTFHTNDKSLYEYIVRFGEWNDYKLTCGAVIDGRFTPTPFNFTTVDMFFDKKQANEIKKTLKDTYFPKKMVSILELLENSETSIREYAQFLYDKDYSLYTAKQWGISPGEIDPSVLKRVPVRLNYDVGYFEDIYQVMPKDSYNVFFRGLLNHPNIRINTGVDANRYISFDKKNILFKDKIFQKPLVYTGAIDELFQWKYGKLPYRSLYFRWRTEERSSFQDAPVVAYPQAEGYTRITEYTKLPLQQVGNMTTYAVEFPIPYQKKNAVEPYYPVLTKESQEIHKQYMKEASRYQNLYVCGRLGDFKYYNMDQALERALKKADDIF